MSRTFRALAGIDYPIVAFSHCRDVVAAVTKAGGMGVLGAAGFSPEELEIELQWIDAQVGGRPYGVDLLVPPPDQDRDAPDLDLLWSRIPDEHRRFVEDLAERLKVPPRRGDSVPREYRGVVVNRRVLDGQIEVALSHPIRFLVSGLGPFTPEVVGRARAQGVLIGGLAGSVDHALRHAREGADIVIAQGYEAGGHTGETSTLVLVPQVVDAVRPTPVLAAGGIVTGRQLAAVLALGAQGAWTGSVWLTTEESAVDPDVIDKLLAAKSSHTVRSRALTGKPVRTLRTPIEDAWEAEGAPPTLKAPYQGVLIQPLLQRVYQHHCVPLMGQACGQGIGMIDARRSCRAVIEEMMNELVDTAERVRDELIN